MVGIVAGSLYVGASKLVVFMKVRPAACLALSWCSVGGWKVTVLPYGVASPA